MSNIGATNTSNIDAQLAAKRAEEEQQKAQAAKLAAEQKAKAEAQKAQADAKSAAAQKGKDAQSTKTKAEDVSIHTAQKTDITATQTSAAKASVHTQVAETKTKETTPQETKSSSPNSATKKVDYGEYLSRTITGGKGTSLFDNPSRTEISSGDMVEFSSTTSKFDTNEEFFKKAKEDKEAALRKLENKQLQDKIYEQRGLTTYQKEHLYLMLKGDNVESFGSFVDIYKELETGSVHSKDHLNFIFKNGGKKGFLNALKNNADFSARYIELAFEQNKNLESEFLKNFQTAPEGLQRGFIYLLDKSKDIKPEVKQRMAQILTSKDTSLDTRCYAVKVLLENKNYTEPEKIQLLQKMVDKDVRAALENVASKASPEERERYVTIMSKLDELVNADLATNDTTSEQTISAKETVSCLTEIVYGEDAENNLTFDPLSFEPAMQSQEVQRKQKENEKKRNEFVEKNTGSFESFCENARKEFKMDETEDALKNYNRSTKGWKILAKELVEEDMKLLEATFSKKPQFKSELLSNFDKVPPRLQRAFISMLDKAPSIQGEVKSKMNEILTSKNTSLDTRVYATFVLLKSNKYDDENKLQLLQKMVDKDVRAVLDEVAAKASKTQRERYVELMSKLDEAVAEGPNSNENEGKLKRQAEIFGATQTGIVIRSAETPEEAKKLSNSAANNGAFDTEEAARAGAEALAEGKKPENVVAAVEKLANNENVHSSFNDEVVNQAPNMHKDAQAGSLRAVNRSSKTTEETRVKIPRVIHKLHKAVRNEVAQDFLAEKRNTESARVMTAFTEQIPNLGVSIDDKTSFYNQVSAIGNVEQQVMQSTRNQLANQYYELTNRTDFDNFAQTISQNSASVNIAATVPVSAVESNYVNSGVTTPSELVKPDKPVGLWGIARSLGGQISAALAEYGIVQGVKPTVAQFVDMLDKEILSAELVVKAGFKDALIQQFSSLSSDAQVAVLGTLTTEEKIMMRKKGLLPRRFWGQVEKQVAQKALEGGDVSNTDAKLLASTASNSVLYQCLNDSSIRLSAQSRSLFQKTLIDNHYLKRDENGQYKKA